MNKIQYGIMSGVFLALCGVLSVGCGHIEQEEPETVKETVAELTAKSGDADAVSTAQQAAREDMSTKLTPEQIDAYQQMTLYIQEGLRTYDIEETYQASFMEIENLDDGTYECSILLEGKEGLWAEQIAYSYDEVNGWYTFEGIFEPVFTQHSFDGLGEDSNFVKDTRENHVYFTEISRKQDFALPAHYDSENGPVEHDTWKIPPNSEWVGRYVRTYLYTYYDDRMDIDIIIEYPQVSLSGSEDVLEEQINETLKKAFFYSDRSDAEESIWNPREQAYGEITRNYVITREDETYFSVRIFEDNYYRGANHPNQSERGITVNMKTGEVLRLQDVVGENQTPLSLLDTGAFHCLWAWKDGNESDEEASENWIQQLHESWKSDLYAELSSFDTQFYLTQDGLGLITEIARYYTPIEATFADLGISF